MKGDPPLFAEVLKMVNSLLSGLETRDLGKYFSKLAAKDWDKEMENYL